MIGEDKFIKFSGCKSNKSCTIGTFLLFVCQLFKNHKEHFYYFKEFIIF